MTSNYGPIVSAWTVEQAVRDTLQAWIDTVLGEIERQSSGRWDRRQIQRPRSWFIQSAFHDLPEKQLPVIHVESSRVAFEHAADGQINGDFPMVVQGVVKSQNRELSRELNAVFEAACRTILEKQGDLGGIAAHTAVQSADYDLVPPDRDRTLMGFEIPIIVTVPAISNRFGGPTVPDAPAPTPIPPTSPTDPAHQFTNITINGTVESSTVTPPATHPATPGVGAFLESVSLLSDLPTSGNNDGDVRLVRDLDTPYSWDAALSQWTPLTAGSTGGLDDETVDTGSHFRLIMFSNGTVRAIPFSTPDPTAPTGLNVTAKLSSVRLTWVTVSGAARYAIFRNGTQIATSTVASYRDINIAVGSTYSYQVQTVDAYGQRSALTSAVSAFIDPAGNSAPTVTVKAWPPTFPTNGKTLLRVNASDIDAQTLALALSVDAGALAATDDPSIWLYAPGG